MRAIRRFGRRAVEVITPEEIDAVDWSRVTRGVIFLDVLGQTHMELHHTGHRPWFHNTRWDYLLWNQKGLYRRLPHRLIGSSLGFPTRDLLGARSFVYHRPSRMLLVVAVGILSWDAMVARGDPKRVPVSGEVRRLAYDTLFRAFDLVALSLGARAALATTATVADEKLRRYGYQPIINPSLLMRCSLRLLTFPLRHQRPYLKTYGDVSHP